MVYTLLFSPTGGTAAVAEALGGGQVVDLTDRSKDFSAAALTARLAPLCAGRKENELFL